MTLDKEEFLKTELGRELKRMITRFDQVVTDDRNRKGFLWCKAQWDVYQMAIRHCYGMGMDFQFVRTEEYFGIWIKDNEESYWLIKVDRELSSQKISARERGFDDSINVDTDSREEERLMRQILQESMEFYRYEKKCPGEMNHATWLFNLTRGASTDQEILQGFIKFYVLNGKGLNNVKCDLLMRNIYDAYRIDDIMSRLRVVLKKIVEGRELNGSAKEAERGGQEAASGGRDPSA